MSLTGSGMEHPGGVISGTYNGFYEFLPAYGGDVGYELGTAQIDQPLLGLLGPFKSAAAWISVRDSFGRASRPTAPTRATLAGCWFWYGHRQWQILSSEESAM